MLTAKDKITDCIKGLEAGADDYVVKPFAMAELFTRVRVLLRRPPHVLSDELSAHDLTINTHAFTVQRSNVSLHLTQKEFAMLEYLLRNKGRIITKQSLIEHLWDYDADILPNTVEACIRNVRNKIDRAFPDKPPLITTIYGFGYRVDG